MTAGRRVVWSDGLFLRPTHFQQMERFLERRVDLRCAGALAPGWGLTHLRLDVAALTAGRLGVAAARGVMPDGTPFALPDDAPVPAALEIPDDTRDVVVSLTLPLSRPGGVDVAFEDASVASPVRWRARDHVVPDTSLPDAEPAEMALGELRLTLARADEPAAGTCGLGVARVRERRPGGGLVLDDDWIAPALDCRGVPALHALLVETRHLMRHRAEAIAGRLAEPARQGASDVSQLLMLQAANRYDALFGHLAERDTLHPESLYATLVQAVGEFATFVDGQGRRPPALPSYRHDDLRASLTPLVMSLRHLLADAAHPNAVLLPLHARAPGLWTTTVPDARLLQAAMFVLAVRADLPADALRRQFPAQAKMGPPDRIRDLVRLHLPAIRLEPLPVTPPRMPYYAGFTYFELQRATPLWQELDATRVIALHVAGEFPGLRLELWALRP
jgi:type VI secretion system protein ImpJ